MVLNRRSFLQSLGAAGAATTLLPLVQGRGLEAAMHAPRGAFAATDVRLDSNENPNGPAPEVLQALGQWFGEAGRYPDFVAADLRTRLAAHLGVPEDHVLLGCGSGELLKVSVEAFVAPDRHAVTAMPTFETVQSRATALKLPFRAPQVDRNLRIDLDAMVAAAPGSGLVFFCNPNNPTGTIHPTDAIEDATMRVLRSAPEAIVLIDEAYFEYVEDPGYRSMIPLALAERRVLVLRTFSKVYGMAGLRLGHVIGHPETLARIRPHLAPNNVNVLAAAAAMATLSLEGHVRREVARNRAVRERSVKFFTDLGYAVVPPAGNFLMVDVRRPAPAFRDACRAQGILVGRPFPPLDTYARISLGTAEEMSRAEAVFRQVLAS